jgi:hypothetical protein
LHKCLDDVASSDIYVGLLGWRYGYIPEKDNPERRSITELEYRQAGKSGLARLIFLVDEGIPWADAFRDSETGEGEGGQRITVLRAELEQATLVSYFRTPDHLAGLVSVAVQRCLQEKSPVREGARQRVQEVKSRALNQRLNSLLEDYQRATEQLGYELSLVDQNRIKRQIAVLEREVGRVENELEALLK